MRRGTAHRVSNWLVAGGVTLICLFFIMIVQVSLAERRSQHIQVSLQQTSPTLVDTTTPTTPTAASLIATPINPTVIALERSVLENQKLNAEITKLQHDTQPSWRDILLTNIPVIIGAVVGIIGIGRWIADRRDARQKSADARFQSAIEGLGSEHVETRVQAATILINFLQPGYKQFYKQIFDLSVVNLGLQRPELPDNMQEEDEFKELSKRYREA